MGTSSAAIFTGSSAYSQDFQNLISRATAIASLPIKQLQADKTGLTDESTALSTLDSKFKAVQSAVDGIAGALSGTSFQADISDPAKLSVNLTEGAVEGAYTVDVVDPGAYATSMSSSKWIAPTGAVRSYRLSIGSAAYAISPTDNSAGAVAAAINTKFGDKVRATVVNVGGASQPDYRISLQASALGDLKPALLTGPATPTSLQTGQTSGSDTLAASRTAQTWDSNPARTFQLSLAGQTYALAPADNTAQGVVDAINAAFGGRVTAAVVNLGDNITPDLRVTLMATGPGDLRPDLLASNGGGPVSLQEQTATGSDVHSVSRTTAAWYDDPGPTLTYQLSLGNVKYNLTPADNIASSLVSEINTKYGDKVTAAVVDLGANGTHDYRITLTAAGPGDLKPNLIVSQKDLQQQQTTGALAHYIVNNSGKDVSSESRSVSIATGVNVNLLAKDGGAPVSITVTRPTSALSSALSTFADAYNAVTDAIDKQHGPGAGALSGQSLVTSLSRALASIGSYASSTGVGALANLGLELDKTGHLTFSSFKLLAADMTGATLVTSFLGSSSGGFIKAANDALQSIESPVSGMLSSAQSILKHQISGLDGSISEHQARVDTMTARMQEQMAAADALIASMQQQYSYMFNMFSAMQNSAQQYK